MIRDGNPYYYHADHQGSIAALTDAAGITVNRYAYEGFGRFTEQSETVANPYAYTGREFDGETGLYYYRARYYDPTVGRFTQRDPIGFTGGLNTYVYVNNNPLLYTDPYGLAAGDWWDIPANIWRGREIADEELSRRPSAHNDIEDAMRHAEWNRRMTKELGEWYAWAIGTGHEFEGAVSGQPWEEFWMDIKNNRTGREAGMAGAPINPDDLVTLDDEPGYENYCYGK